MRENHDQKRKDKLKQKIAQLKRKASNMTSEALITEFDKIVNETDEVNEPCTIWVETRWLGQKPWFLSPGTTL